jgi:hypothetical protein
MDLADYTRARDEFYTNQDRQYGILDREASRGERNVGQYAGQVADAYGAMGDYAMGGANARAAGTAGAANAWGDMAGDIGSQLGGYAMYQGMFGGNSGVTGGRGGPAPVSTGGWYDASSGQYGPDWG